MCVTNTGLAAFIRGHEGPCVLISSELHLSQSSATELHSLPLLYMGPTHYKNGYISSMSS